MKTSRIVRARMKLTGERYTIARMRLYECPVEIFQAKPGQGPSADVIAAESVKASPPRTGP